MVKALYEGRLAVDIAGLKMQTPVTTGSGTFGFGLEFTDFLDLEKVGAVTVKGTSLLPAAGNKGQRAVETPSGMLLLLRTSFFCHQQSVRSSYLRPNR